MPGSRNHIPRSAFSSEPIETFMRLKEEELREVSYHFHAWRVAKAHQDGHTGSMSVMASMGMMSTFLMYTSRGGFYDQVRVMRISIVHMVDLIEFSLVSSMPVCRLH
jgi:hypothetical protein